MPTEQEQNKAWQVPTECICPGCGKKHIKEIFFTGKGIPKYFCKKCKKEQESTEESFLFVEKPIAYSSKKDNDL